jgi:hypothetical protein
MYRFITFASASAERFLSFLHNTRTHCAQSTIYCAAFFDMVPTEVLENIFTYLVPREGGYYDLWQSSLVCRAWRDPAQRFAFRAIRVLTHKD